MELLGRRYGHIRITDVVGQGGMGDVYAGYHEKLDRKVALKVLHAENRLDAEARERLLREARALSKLDHPHICRIYDYIESDDVDLLVLEFIDGQTLQDAILEQKLTRADKLRIAIEIAEVLVAAHRLGIIHRDLKPDNVMLTRKGEVKVLDFGLARWLNPLSSDALKRISGSQQALGAASAAGVPLPADSDHEWFSYAGGGGGTQVLPRYDSSAAELKPRFLHTEAGVTMGTPLYMSPEQARGEELTTASDMFALGLVLQALFTGGDPHPPGLTAREVILRAARGETVEVDGVAGDITALINRLKQFAPADRPTAMETVARLRHLNDKPRRIVRRSAIAAAALIVILGVWRYTVDLARERTIAVEARADAEKRRVQAENLIEFMIGDLRVKLEKVGRLEVLEDVGKRAIAYVDSLEPDKMSVEDLVRSAKSLNQFGEVRVGQGKTPEALDLFRRSLRLANEAVKREPRNPEALKVFGVTHFWIGNGLQKQAKHDEALRHMREYMKSGDALASVDPASEEYQLEKAYGHSGVAYMLEQKGQLAEALEHYKISLAVKDGLARRDPSDTNAQAEVARAYNKLAVVLYKQGDLRSSLDYSRREVDLYRRLVALEPKHAPWKKRLANSMAFLVRALEDTGDRDAAFALLKEELAIEKELSSGDPSNVGWQRDVAMTNRWIAWETYERGDRARALALYEDARAQIAQVQRQAPTHATVLVDVLTVDNEFGYLLATGGDRRGMDILRGVVRRAQQSPDNRAVQVQLARSEFFQGEVLARHDPRAATEAWTRAERHFEPLVAAAPPGELALWFRILVRRNRAADARAVLARLDRIGYSTTQLKELCAENGC